MKIQDREINLKITPRAIEKAETRSKLDVLKLLREVKEVEPKLSDYYKLIYAGYLGATNEDITYEAFLDLIKDIDMVEIAEIGVDLLLERKN
ncbi:MAG: hypothetical protein J6K45_04850 [Clostridia bacterium]|nr:hypothetical protein [Clostridia bacterium]